MDTLKILLGATVALLLGALGVSLIQQKPAAESAGAAEKEEVLRKVEALRLELNRLQTEKSRQALQEAAARIPDVAPLPVAPTPIPSAELEAMQAEIARLQAEKEKAERDAQTADREAAYVGGRVLENRDQEARRARMITDAMLIGRISEWQETELGNFAIVEVVMRENVQQGTILCVRRNSGILGKLRIDEVSIEGTIASPVTAFSGIRPQSGDELILEPPFYRFEE